MQTLNLVSLSSGTRILLASGEIVVIVENPGDGTWLFCKPVNAQGEVDEGAAEQPVFAQDVVGLASSTAA